MELAYLCTTHIMVLLEHSSPPLPFSLSFL